MVVGVLQHNPLQMGHVAIPQSLNLSVSVGAIFYSIARDTLKYLSIPL
jgi:hypothetical protein